MVSDIFGASSGRHQGIADSYAQFGYNVYVPEILPEVYSGPLDFPVIVAYIKNLNKDKMTETFKRVSRHTDLGSARRYSERSNREYSH